GPHAARAPGGAGSPEQAVPDVSQPRRRRRAAWSGARRHRDAPDPRSAHPSGPARWRQHAGVRKESQPRRGERAGRIHGNAAAMIEWTVEPSVSIPVAIAALVYLRGWSKLRRRLPSHFSVRHAVSFVGGLATLLLALASPVDAVT